MVRVRRLRAGPLLRRSVRSTACGDGLSSGEAAVTTFRMPSVSARYEESIKSNLPSRQPSKQANTKRKSLNNFVSFRLSFLFCQSLLYLADIVEFWCWRAAGGGRGRGFGGGCHCFWCVAVRVLAGGVAYGIEQSHGRLPPEHLHSRGEANCIQHSMLTEPERKKRIPTLYRRLPALALSTTSRTLH